MRLTRRGILALWLAFVLACAAVVAQTRVSTDMSAFLPQRPTPEQRILVDQLREGVLSRLVLVGIEGADAPTRAKISRAMAARLRGDPDFSAVANGEPVGLERERALLFSHRYLLSPAVDAAHFSRGGLHAALSDSIDLIASPLGMMVKPLLPRDPSGELIQIISRLGTGQQAMSGDGVWISRDGQRAVLLAHTRASGADIDAQQRAVGHLRAAFEQARTASGAQGVALQMSGPGVFAVTSRATIEHEALRLSALGAVLVIALLLLLYRSFTALLLGILPVACGALAGVAAVSLGFGTVHGLTLGFGTTLIGEAVDYSIYLFVQSERRKTGNWIADFWPTIRLGVLTSVIGFASLLFSGFPGLAQLGLYSIAGLSTAALVTRHILPLLLPDGFKVRDTTPLGRRLVSALSRAPALRPLVAVLALAAIAVLVQHRDTIWNDQLSSLSPVPAADMALDARLRADLGAPDTRLLVVIPAPSREAALIGAEQAASRLQPLVDAGVLAGFDTPAKYLPSQRTQWQRRAALPAPDVLRERLNEATQDLPLKAERLAGFLSDVEAARRAPLLDRADLDGSTLALAVDALLQGRGTHWSALLPLRAPPGRDIDSSRVRAAINGLPGQPLLLDIKNETNRLYGGYLREAIVLSCSGLGGIVVLLSVALRDARRVLGIVAPLAIAVLLVTAGLVLAGVQLTILHLVGMLLIVAVGSNYALFFDRRADAGQARTLASLLFANLATVSGFGLLAASSVPVLQALGDTVGPGAILALLLSAIMARRCIY
ncbi:MMPL family transporter [Paludibacterium yongneupense]|uniref:MMPL family transporter n=1 Tax=Paludibacterium yongneupense TaxID=400061 RepID=UPI0003FD5CB8|nr:MMPL family transporter [Paludibacterium yongneupense]